MHTYMCTVEEGTCSTTPIPLCTAPVHDFSTINNNTRSPFEVVNTCQPHRVHIVALQVKYLLCAKATTRECVGRVAERETLLAPIVVLYLSSHNPHHRV